MKKQFSISLVLSTTLWLVLLAFSSMVRGQTGNGYEFWFDQNFDARQSQDQNVFVENGFAYSFKVDTLTDGFHTLNIRFRQAETSTELKWSAVSTYRFFKKTPVAGGFFGYETWFDEDFDNRTTQTLSAPANDAILVETEADISTLSDGFHTFSIRTRSESGWSAVSTYRFFKKTPVAGGFFGYETWFDEDFDNRTTQTLSAPAGDAILVQTETDISTLPDGFHTFSIRTRSESGWSAVSTYRFFKKTPVAGGFFGYETWFDEDFDNRTTQTLSAPAGDAILVQTETDISTLPDGFHTFSIRTRSESGWSAVSTYRFFKKTPVAGGFFGYETWFDEDFDNRTTQTLSAPTGDAILVQTETDISTLPDGFHTFSIRTRSESGWSAVSTYRFFKKSNLPADGGITGWEFWWGDNFTTRQFHAVQPPAQDMFLLDEIWNIDTLCRGKYQLNLRFFGQNGWSGTSSFEFEKTVPALDEEVADFTLVADGNLVAFSNLSKNTDKFRWIFGDGQSDTLRNPLHKYSTFGTYQIALVAYGRCQNDTLRKTLLLPGVSDYSPKRGGQNGTVTVAFSGLGFVPAGMDVRLKRNGESDLVPETISVANTGQMSAKFKFQDAKTGLWDVSVKFPNGSTRVFPNGFLMEESTYNKLSVKITANWRMRREVKNTLTVTVINDGNTDADWIPVTISGFPDGTTMVTKNPRLNIENIPVFDTLVFPPLDSIPLVHKDKNGDESITVIVPKIPAGQSSTIQIEVIPPTASVPNSEQKNITATVGKPLGDASDPESDLTMDCLFAIAEEAVNTILGSQADIIQCFVGIGVTTSEIIRNAAELIENDPTKQDAVLEAPQFFYGMLETMRDCADAAGVAFPFSKVLAMVDIMITFLDGIKVNEKCGTVFEKIGQDFWPVTFGTSWDPNIKVGPGSGSSGNFYNTDSRPLIYMIAFENDTSALFAAQTVRVIDTLDVSKLDLSTFRFTYVNVGGRGVGVSTSGTQFIRDIWLPHAGVTARASGSLDTLKGIVTWVIRTIDPATNQETTDPEAGILQPNLDPPEGDGSVGFIIHKKAGLPDSVRIENRAVIIFDQNPPILTNTWGVTSDNVPPESEIGDLPAVQDSTNVHLAWTGMDNLSGVQFYQIFVSDNNGPFYQWQAAESDTTAVFTGVPGHHYRFYSLAVDSAGNVELPPFASEFDAEISIEGVVRTEDVVGFGKYVLSQNIPNPFNGQTRIDFSLPERCPQVILRVLRISGETLREFVWNEQPAGEYSVFFEASELPSGIYFYQLRTEAVLLTRRMVVQRE